MICPNCNSKMRVTDSRNVGNVTFRRYSCDCGVKLYTEEKENRVVKSKLSRIRYEKG